MKERMQKTLSQVNDSPQRDRSETEWYGGVQTFMWMCEDNIVDVPFDKDHLFAQILSPSNLSRAYKAVMRNKGCGGIDKMSCEQLLPWLMTNKDVLIRSLMDGSYRPNPVKRVEIPKDNGKMRLLGIPTVVDRVVQQAINQVLTPIYENQFSKTSYGFRPISLGAAINLGLCFLHSFLHEVRFNYYRLIVRFSSSCTLSSIGIL